MKTILFLFILLQSIGLDAKSFKEGDNLNTEFSKISKSYYFPAPSFTEWTEGKNMFLIGSKPNPTDCRYLFIALDDSTVIGMFKIEPPNYFLIDSDGDSILDMTSDLFLLPSWLIKKNTKIDPENKSILELFNKMYEKTLESDKNEMDAETATEYSQYKLDTNLANRHIAFLFDTYITVITHSASQGKNTPSDITIPLMKTLSGECISLFNNIPVIICVYMGEALQSAGMIKKAREHFQMSLQFYPNSIPLQVYNYKLELDEEKKEKMLENLKKQYSTHWMVKDL